MYRKLICISLLALSVGCKKEKPAQQEVVSESDKIVLESKKVNDFFEQSFNAYLAVRPQMQTRLGSKENYDKWNDISPAFQQKELEKNEVTLQWLKDSVDIQYLDAATALSYRLYKKNIENKINDYKFRVYGYPLNQMHGMQAEIPAFLINMHTIANKKEAVAYLMRLEGIVPLFDQLILNLKESEAAGVMIPKFVFTHVINDAENLIKGFPFDDSKVLSTLFQDFKDKIVKIDLSADENDQLFMEAEAVLKDAVKPAYEKLIAFLKEQQERATTDDGVWKFPEGADFYNTKLARITTTSMTADEIHEVGLQEVARIHKAMEAIKDQVGFQGSLTEFFEYMRTDKRFYYAPTDAGKEAYMEKAKLIIKGMEARLDELFITKPKAPLRVKAVEGFREKSAGKAFYQGPSEDGSRPGTYYANMYDLKAMPTYQMEALAYHEGIPGHHMQISIAQELKEIPEFRKYMNYTAYIEGWGLYSEFIPKEMGFYEDPYSDFGRLAMELWRSCRLVVDTGIHAKKWTRAQGIAYYSENTPNAMSDCVKMVERHIVMPGQATSYKVGMNKIIELREQAKQKLGEAFNIREFHEVVLTNGALPLTVLEELVDEWVLSKKE